MMGIPSVIVVRSCGDVIVDLDRAVSDGFEYGEANEGFDEEDGAGMWQQAGERICEECIVAKSHKTKLHITDCQSCHQSIPEHNIMVRHKPQGLRKKQANGILVMRRLAKMNQKGRMMMMMMRRRRRRKWKK